MKVPRFGRPARQDAVAGFVTGLFSIPEGMAYASIGGFNPLLGLYSGMVPTVVGSLFSRTVLMTTTLTSALALTSYSVLDQAGLDPNKSGNIAMLALLAGGFMLLLGVLRMGSLMSFVSNAVMTGFTTGIALQIIAGAIGDATTYETDFHNTFAKLVDALVHVGSWDSASVAVTGATVLIWAVVHAVRRLEPYAVLLALVVTTTVVVIAGIDVRQVGDIGSIPNALPAPVMPHWSAAPDLVVGSVAVALVALAQAAGIGAAVPNPDGSRTSISGDFKAQGLANVAGSFFQALPTGGSLSRTGVSTSAGARSRWAGIFAGLILAVLVLVAGGVAEVIPMPVIGGLILVIGAELVVGRLPDIRLVLGTGLLPAVAMVGTFAATTQLPLQQAILLGAGLSLLLFCVNAQRHARLRCLVRQDDGRWRAIALPDRVEPYSVLVLHYEGVSLFAEVARLEELWPSARDTHDAVVIFHVRTLPDVPSSTLVKSLEKRAQALNDRGCRLMVVGLDAQLLSVFEHAGAARVIGEKNLVMRTPVFFESLDDAYDRALAWVAARRGRDAD